MPPAVSQKKLTQPPHGGKGLRILVAPLDWGLGHATRCIPVIQLLMNNGAEVLLAGEGKMAALLSEAFPGLTLLPLKGYGVHYSGRSLAWSLVKQVPKILRVIRAEHRWLQQAVQEHHIHAVISDNRYGLYHPAIPTVIITHQLRIQTGFGPGPDGLLQRLHYRYLNRFSFCWVPDAPQAPGLAGALSHPQKLPKTPVYCTGALSRFTLKSSAPKTHDLLFLLSGPEPQRTRFEEMVCNSLKNFSGNAVLVRGLPGTAVSPLHLPPNIQVYAHLPSVALEKAISGARWVVCRSGYSTLMDLAALGAQALLVPTPGQTEQEYLARHAQEQGWAIAVAQKDFDLTILTQAPAVHFHQTTDTAASLHTALEALFVACG